MSTVYHLPEHHDALEEACAWVARLDRQLTEEEEETLREWLRSSGDNVVALDEAAQLWNRMNAMSRLAELTPAPAADRRKNSNYLMAAAALLAAIGVGLVLAQQGGTPSVKGGETAKYEYFELMSTDVGQQRHVTLPDGSNLILNTDTQLSVRFGPGERIIELKTGEVYVKVAHDQRRPLRVVANDRVVHSIGTEFNVVITKDQKVEVMVTEGKVLIGLHYPDSDRTLRSEDHSGDISLVAGQKVLLAQDTAEVAAVEPDAIEVQLSWRDGNLIFQGVPLEQALREVERYTAVEFVIMDESLREIRVAGFFKTGDVEGLLKTLRQNFNIVHERLGPKTIALTSE